MIFIFWLKWLHLEQFTYGDYESEVAFFLSHQDFSKSAFYNFYINTKLLLELLNQKCHLSEEVVSIIQIYSATFVKALFHQFNSRI